MLLIDPKFIDQAKKAKAPQDLFELLQNAIRLEHATIPPYLTAAYSLKLGINSEIRTRITNIAAEEMLHMAIVANILNAIGGRPKIDAPEFIPVYPASLPMSIGGGFEVGLSKFSRQLVHDIFMKIETPEIPIHFEDAGLLADKEYSTIGVFYKALETKIQELGDVIFTGDASRQVLIDAGFPSEQLFAIRNTETAVRALQRISKEGEGTKSLPFDDENEPAHFYGFEEIDRGRLLVKNDMAVNGYVYGGREIPFDPNEVWDFPDNSKSANYPQGTEAREKVDAFNKAYSEILRVLQKAFDGDPGQIRESIFLMGRLRRVANDVLKTPDPNNPGKQCGLTFEYVPTQP